MSVIESKSGELLSSVKSVSKEALLNHDPSIQMMFFGDRFEVEDEDEPDWKDPTKIKGVGYSEEIGVFLFEEFRGERYSIYLVREEFVNNFSTSDFPAKEDKKLFLRLFV